MPYSTSEFCWVAKNWSSFCLLSHDLKFSRSSIAFTSWTMTSLNTFLTIICLTALGAQAGNRNGTADFFQSWEPTRHPKEFYIKAHGFMVNSEPFKNFTLIDSIRFIDSLEDWEPPAKLASRFPYYLSGFDDEERPVWVSPIGTYNVRKVLEEGPEAAADLEKYAFQACLHVLESMESRKALGIDVEEIFLIADWEGMDVSQVAHLPTVIFSLRLFQTYSQIITLALGQVVAINVSFAAELALNIARPVLGSLFQKTDIFGTDRARWSAALRRLLPENVIPNVYGGRKDYVPVKIYG